MFDRLSKRRGDKGFTLIELLVVMIIIGILAAIGIPLFLSQRQKAWATGTQADVSTLGKEIATYYVDNTGAAPAVVASSAAGTQMTVNLVEVGLPSDGTERVGAGATGGQTDWCIALENTLVDGDNVWAYSAERGLEGPLAATPC